MHYNKGTYICQALFLEKFEFFHHFVRKLEKTFKGCMQGKAVSYEVSN